MINEKGVTWRCAAHQPRFAPFHLRFHPLLRRSFRFSFCSLSFSPFASSYLRCTYFVNEVPLLFRFFLPSAFPPFLSFSFFLLFFHFAPLYLERLIFLLQPSPSRIFALPYFSTGGDTPNAARSFSFGFHPPERFRRIAPRPMVPLRALLGAANERVINHAAKSSPASSA